MSNHNEISSFIWRVCDDILRKKFKNYEYGEKQCGPFGT